MQSTILIVDDVPENISTLFHFLDINNFEVLVARDGESALELIEYQRPDLILLDVMMPGIDGFETCRRLKTNSNTKEIPVIFMTALSDTLDKVKGFEIGAVDYITKPIQQEEALARINTHVTIYKLKQQLEAFSYTVAHDLKNPIHDVISMSDLLKTLYSDDLNIQGKECVEHILRSSYKMVDIINALLLLANVSTQGVNLTSVDMKEVISSAEQRLATMIEQYNAKIFIQTDLPQIISYVPWLEEVWVNYLSNAIKYGGTPACVEIGASQEAETICFWIRDNGLGLDKQAMAKLFTPFTRLHQTSVEEGHGLGLSIVQRIIEKLGGEVGVESEIGKGSRFYFTFQYKN
ncbi:sensor histidine kinase [Candidatus Marithrix sp. Canyon 246]|uniref:sensor histidine kinase n=1 Tax=Candidatus Marithrix sp. Canyon 246 TaxID=1827136 RepID=UPI00084A0AE2|nr:response regulator [Candidatus Marithrix sp. Canyon 246]